MTPGTQSALISKSPPSHMCKLKFHLEEEENSMEAWKTEMKKIGLILIVASMNILEEKKLKIK